MSKISAEALVKLQTAIEDGKLVQMEKFGRGYEVTVWDDMLRFNHSHYQGETLIEAIMKAFKE